MPGYRPTSIRPPAPKPAEVGVRFAKLAASVWQGNGFAVAGAEWVALMGSTEVGRFEGAWSEVFGDRAYGTTVGRWRERIAREATQGL